MFAALYRFLFSCETEGEDGGWGNLPSGVVDGVINALKRTGGWRRDGPAVRLMNKHWSYHLSQHVSAVRPHSSRSLVRKDLQSLVKFPRLTELDVTPFLVCLQRRPSVLTPSKASHVRKLVNVLCQLPRLSRIEIEAKRLTVSGSGFIHKESCPWKRLQSVTTLCLYKETNPKLDEEGLAETDSLPYFLQEEAVTDIDLSPFFRQFAQLQRVNALLPCHWSPDNLDFLEESFSVHLHEVSCTDLIEYFPNPRCVRSAISDDPDECDMDILSQVPELEGLRLRVQGTEPSNGQALLREMRALKRLDMKFVNWLHGGLRNACLESLECVTLKSVEVDVEELVTNLRRLRDLRLVNCRVASPSAFPDSLNGIQALCLNGIRTCSGAEVLVDFASQFFGNLASLQLGDVQSGAAPSVEHLTKLEVLDLAVSDCGGSQLILEAAARLPNLRWLTLRNKSNLKPFPADLPSQLLTKLERLKLCGVRLTPTAAAMLRDMRAQAPWRLLDCAA